MTTQINAKEIVSNWSKDTDIFDFLEDLENAMRERALIAKASGNNVDTLKFVAHKLKEIWSDEIEGNANLIAAAPDLLEALQQIVEYYADHMEVATENTIHVDSMYRTAKHAIAKAEGR